MAFDRQIHLTVRGEGTFMDGSPVPGPVLFEANVWAQYRDAGEDALYLAQDVTARRSQTFRVRWLAVLSGADVFEVDVSTTVAGESVAWNVVRITEVAVPRRRYIDLTCDRTE